MRGLTKPGLLAVGAVVVLLLGGLAALLVPGSDAPPASVSAPGGGPPQAPYPEIPVGAPQYEVLGDGPATIITYVILSGDTHSRDQPLPWRKPTAGEFYMSLSASRGDGPGDITCRVTGEGKILATETKSGPWAKCSVTVTR